MEMHETESMKDEEEDQTSSGLRTMFHLLAELTMTFNSRLLILQHREGAQTSHL